MSTNTTEVSVTLRISEHARSRLAEQAANSGRDIASVASELIELSVVRPTVDELLAPVRQQVAQSGMNDEQLETFLRDELDAHRREKKANSA